MGEESQAFAGKGSLSILHALPLLVPRRQLATSKERKFLYTKVSPHKVKAPSLSLYHPLIS